MKQEQNCCILLASHKCLQYSKQPKTVPSLTAFQTHFLLLTEPLHHGPSQCKVCRKCTRNFLCYPHMKFLAYSTNTNETAACSTRQTSLILVEMSSNLIDRLALSLKLLYNRRQSHVQTPRSRCSKHAPATAVLLHLLFYFIANHSPDPPLQYKQTCQVFGIQWTD